MRVANSPLFRWWCCLVCGKLTNGGLCRPWCSLAQKYGLWTLWITLPLPVVVVFLLLYLIRGS